MAFRLAVSAHESFEVQIFQSDTTTIARAYIGSDEEEDVVYSALVALTLKPAKPDNHKELLFYIIEAGPETVDELNSGLSTKRFLRGEHRTAVLGCVCALVSRVAEVAQPDVISMATVEANLPEKALSKYVAVCQALYQAGYTGGRGNSYHGTELWMFTRAGGEL